MKIVSIAELECGDVLKTSRLCCRFWMTNFVASSRVISRFRLSFGYEPERYPGIRADRRDRGCIQCFNLSIYPVSTAVRLSNGQLARVKEAIGRPILRPAVEVFCEVIGFPVEPPYLLELQKQPSLVIVGEADN